MHKYPSDIIRKQFSGIRHILEKERYRTKPMTLNLHEVLCAIIYILKRWVVERSFTWLEKYRRL